MANLLEKLQDTWLQWTSPEPAPALSRSGPADDARNPPTDNADAEAEVEAEPVEAEAEASTTRLSAI